MSEELRSIEAITERARKTKGAALQKGAAAVAPGYVLSTEYSVMNGIRYVEFKRTESPTGEDVIQKKIIVEKDIYKRAQRAVTRARYLTDEHTSQYISGLKFVELDKFSTIDRALSELREEADNCNELLSLRRSDMHVKIEIYKFPVDTTDRRNAIRLAQLIHERLIQLKAMYEDQRINAYKIYLDNMINLETTVTGPQRELIELAVAATKAQRDRMILNYGGKRGTMHLQDVDAAFNYEAIDAAIAVFAPSLQYS